MTENNPVCVECESINTHSSFCSRYPYKTPLTGWRIGDAGFTIFGPKTDAPAPRILLTGKDRDVVRLAAAAPVMLEALRGVIKESELFSGEEPGWIKTCRKALTAATGD